MRKSQIKMILFLLFIIAITMLNTSGVFAATDTHANSATSYSGNELKSVISGDSIVNGYGCYSKITLYLATTNDVNQGIIYGPNGLIDMEKTPVTRTDGQPMFVKFGKSLITKTDYTLVNESYVNLDTCKFDTLIDFKNGNKNYPIYKTKLSDSQLSYNVGVPRWLTYDKNGNTVNNQSVVVDFFKGHGDNEEAANVLKKLIYSIAENSDSSAAIGKVAVNNILKATIQRVPFKYINLDGSIANIDITNVLPSDEFYYAHWLIVYEPVINYHQDPNKMFFPETGGNSFLITASDAVLQSMHSGTAGYPSVVKFFTNTPKVTLHYNHCNICGKIWYGYPDWAHSDLPLARYCPLPCPGISKDYDGVKTANRYPFSVHTPFEVAAKNFTIEKNWLKYSGGFLFDVPTGNLDELVVDKDKKEDSILHYGGYSLFVNGPQKPEPPADEKVVTSDAEIYVRTVMLNKDFTFTPVPNVLIKFRTKNDIIDPEEKQKLEENVRMYINKYPTAADELYGIFMKMRDEEYITNEVVTQAGFTKVSISTPKNEDDDATDLVKSFKLLPAEISSIGAKFGKQAYNVGIKSENIPGYKTKTPEERINEFVDTLVDAGSKLSFVSINNPITLKDGRMVGPQEDLQARWKQVAVYASNDGGEKSFFDIDGSKIYLYDEDSYIWRDVVSDFALTGDKLYITIVFPVIEVPILIPTESTDPGILLENELTKAIEYDDLKDSISKITVEKNCTETNCSGTTSRSYTYIATVRQPDGTYKQEPRTGWETVNCGHSKTLSNAKNITPKSLSVQTNWFWDASMFNGVSRLSVLRPTGTLVNDGKTFVFNTTSSFTATDMKDAFDKITGYKFIAHRSADPKNNGAVKPLQLAAYMNDTSENKNYLNFITPYYGGTYPSAYNNPTGYFGQNEFSLYTSLNLPSSVTAVGSGSFCSGGSSNSLNIPVKLSGTMQYGGTTEISTQFKTTTPVRIDETVASVSKSAEPFATTKKYFGIDPNGVTNPMYVIQVQSDSIKFNPAFKMRYQDSNNVNSAYKDVWILAKGEKTFISNDFVAIQVYKDNLNVSAPWSRDSEDKMTEKGTPRTIPTAKSGNAIKATANGAMIKIDTYFHIQDPNFVDSSQRASVQAINNAKVKQFDDMVANIANTFKNNGVSFYSNMFQSTTANTLNKVSAPNFFKDLTEKTTLSLAKTIKTKIDSQTTAYYLDGNGIADYTTPSRTINLNGETLPATTRWTDISAVRSQVVLNNILEKNGGIKVSGWYNEDYEGILVIKKTYIITLNDLETTYAQIHPQHSDFKTSRNELAQQLRFVQGTEILIQNKQYGVGVEYRLPTLTINGQTFSDIVLPSKPYLFDIRGSTYDVN